MKSPHLNGKRSFVFCPVCRGIFVNRYKGRCPHCGIGIAYKGEFFLNDDIVIDTNGLSYRAIGDNNKYKLRETTTEDLIFFINSLFEE